MSDSFTRAFGTERGTGAPPRAPAPACPFTGQPGLAARRQPSGMVEVGWLHSNWTLGFFPGDRGSGMWMQHLDPATDTPLALEAATPGGDPRLIWLSLPEDIQERIVHEIQTLARREWPRADGRPLAGT